MNHIIKEKFIAFIIPLFSLIFLFSGLVFIKEKLGIQNELIWEVPLYISSILCVVLFFINNFMAFIKIWAWFTILVMITSILLMTIFLILVALNIQNNISIIIYGFLSIFYLAISYDIYRLIKYPNRIYIVSKIYNLMRKNTEVSYINFMQIISKETYSIVNKNITYKLFMLFSLPFILLGKGAAYFLTLGVGEYLNSKEYIIATLGFVLISFLFMTLLPSFIVIIRFKYPSKKEKST